MYINSLNNNKIGYNRPYGDCDQCAFKSKYVAFLDQNTAEQLDCMVTAIETVHNKLVSDDDISQNLKKTYGILKVNKNIEDGIVFDGEKKNYIFSVHSDRSLRVREQNKISGEIEESFYVKNRQLVKSDTRNNIPENIEYFQFKSNVTEKELYFKEILDDVDFRLLKLRKAIIASKSLHAVPQNSDFIVQQLQESKEITQQKFQIEKPEIQTDLPIVLVKPCSPEKGFLSPREEELVKEIIEEFNDIHTNLKSIKNSITRSKIKNGYSNINKGMAGSKVLEFSSIGPSCDDISVNMINDHYVKHLVIKLKDIHNREKNIIINPDGNVLKKPTMCFVRDAKVQGKENKPQYYTQKELNQANFGKQLFILKHELKNYNNFILERTNHIEETKKKYTTTDVGSTEYCNDLINSVCDKYKTYKNSIVMLRTPEDRAKIRNIHNIFTKKGNPSIIFNRITSEKEDIHLSFPMLNRVQCTKILVMKNDKIKKTLIVENEKLLKFEADNIHSRKKIYNEYHYYTQEEIDNSGLREYLRILDCALDKINSAIQDEIKK